MSKCIFCGRAEEEINGVNMRADYHSIHCNYLFKDVKLPFVFHYDQNEGRVAEGANISFYEVNACQECLIKGSGFRGYGALGANEYSIGSNIASYDEINKRAEEISNARISCKDGKISELESQVVFARKHPVKNLLNCLSPLKRYEL